ncbi:putative geranylgeranyl transferase type-1 subunit beta [Erysiphe necator]|uniref:Geranylgeranyl transferase type-1 subunit beta n=1 Tax=Uncinula necator TaxID=52586 RepID=A0A0B1P0V6_UNCNE|nr:putative geranylgeranyl transferase type-1 subunit beta [Erysiphe necator]
MEGKVFKKGLHIKYWKRCLNSLLPTEYTGNDSSRMTLGFFILSALDLLGESVSAFPYDQKIEIRDWILKCQHPNGGFCGSPNHRFPEEYYLDLSVDGNKSEVDPANLPATYFAILSLGLVGDLRKIERIKCLRWLKKLQREDGSFGELLTLEGKIWGGRDMRYCYVAAAIRWILGGDQENFEDDINVENLVQHVLSGQTYDGGISETSQHEAHAGYTYCGIATLSLLGRLPSSTGNCKYPKPGLCNFSETLRWLVSRQVGYQVVYNEKNKDEISEDIGINLQEMSLEQADIKSEISSGKKEYVGFNGRCNKRVDTCYVFWVIGSIKLLCEEYTDLVDKLAARQFLIEQTQYKIGGFSKSPGDPPDIYHSYLGLAALALNNEPDIKKLDPALCISIEQKNKINRLRSSLLVPKKFYWKHGYYFCEPI